jgi:hypothetical protein
MWFQYQLLYRPKVLANLGFNFGSGLNQNSGFGCTLIAGSNFDSRFLFSLMNVQHLDRLMNGIILYIEAIFWIYVAVNIFQSNFSLPKICFFGFFFELPDF